MAVVRRADWMGWDGNGELSAWALRGYGSLLSAPRMDGRGSLREAKHNQVGYLRELWTAQTVRLLFCHIMYDFPTVLRIKA
jgi:hypothetical protein